MEQVPETMPIPIPAKYQVFINHRGPDVKKTLASLIYHRLTHCGLNVFLDESEIRPGDSVSQAIRAAIRSASVHVAIFSVGYAESIWCLDELHLMLTSCEEGQSKIIPVFWDVEPGHLRYIKKGYAIAFGEHGRKDRVSKEVLEKWKTDLKKASYISGLVFKTKEGDLGRIVENIAELVLKEEVFRSIPVESAKYPVGLHKAAGDFENKFRHRNATSIVVIVGMVGVGKSILAKHLYQMRRPKFSRSCFLYDVGKGDLLSLQKNLLHDLRANCALQNIHNSHRGKHTLQDFFSSIQSERIFIVLDNVDGIDKIDGLLDMDAVPSGSLIFITCHDKDLLRDSSAKLNGVNTLVYDVEPLQEKHARRLFCQHALGKSEPPPAFEDLVEKSLQISGGVPLCLEVLGKFFARNCDKEKWKLHLRTMPRGIRDALKGISYDSLGEDQQELFLDIGCFFVGEEKELTIRVLERSYANVGECLDSLRKKCLVDYKIECRKCEDPMIGYNNSCRSLEIITMPVPLRELARDIARTEFLARTEFHMRPWRQPLRLSCSDDIQILSEQAQDESIFQIRGIRSSKGENSPDFSKKIRDIKAENVRILVAEDLVDLSSFFNSWKISGELLWLRLGNLSVFDFPPSISLQSLRVLELEGPDVSVQHLIRNVGVGAAQSGTSIFRYWEGGISHFRRWKQQSIFQYLKSRVKGMGNLTNLELTNITSINSLPIDFSQLPNVTHLNLSGCVNLTDIPDTFSELLKLKYLALQDCEKLSIPLDILGKISTLVYVDFKGCAKLIVLPRGIPHQKDLRYLNLLCTGLLELPKDLKLLDKLEQLSIGNPVLNLPLPVANSTGLKELLLIQSSGLRTISQAGVLIQCSSLRTISLAGIAERSVRSLTIDGCPIASLSLGGEGMSLLRDFTMKNTSISEIWIPEFVYPQLKTLDLSKNSRLKQVIALPSTLVSLHLQHCLGLEKLTGLSNLVNLKFLNLKACSNLEILNVEGLTSLKEIEAEACWKLQNVVALSLRKRLNCLHISTDNNVIWKEICEFLTSSSRQKPATAIFSARANENQRRQMAVRPKMRPEFDRDCNHKILDIFSTEKLENIHSYGAILMFFITDEGQDDASLPEVCVTFKPNNSGSALEYRIARANRGGSLNVFMWTEESRLFKEYKGYSNSGIHVSCSHLNRKQEGWIVMVDKNADVSKVCNEIIKRFRVDEETAMFHSVGQESAAFLASCGILCKAREESCLAINSESYSLNE